MSHLSSTELQLSDITIEKLANTVHNGIEHQSNVQLGESKLPSQSPVRTMNNAIKSIS